MSVSEPSNQAQVGASQGEVKSQNIVGSTQPAQALVSQSQLQKQVKVMLSSDDTSRPRPPFDPVPFFYWLLFILLVPTIAFLMAHKPVSQVGLPLLTKEVPAYHLITSDDVSVKWVDPGKVTGETVSNEGDLIGHYTLVALQVDQPVLKNQIAPQPPAPAPDASLITNTLAVAIPASDTTILGGSLRAGDIVSMAAVPNTPASAQPVTVFSKVLVLDVKPNGNQSVIVLAIPADSWLDYLAKTRNATVVLAREVG